MASEKPAPLTAEHIDKLRGIDFGVTVTAALVVATFDAQQAEIAARDRELAQLRAELRAEREIVGAAKIENERLRCHMHYFVECSDIDDAADTDDVLNALERVRVRATDVLRGCA